MASEMMSDSGDDCIIIDESKENSCDGEKSAQVISVPDSSDATEKVNSSATSRVNKVISDKNDESPATVQQDGPALQSTEASRHSQNTKSCKQCGHVGSQESFCGRYKNYCSLKCVRLFRLAQHGQYSNPGTVAAAPSVQTNPSVHVQSSSSASATGARLSKSSAIVPVSAAKQLNAECIVCVLCTAASSSRLLDWKEYVLRENATVAPVTCFKHCSFSENFCRTLLVGVKLEVINTDTEITDYPVYWMASVTDVAGYAVCLRYEGYEDDASHDFWINFYSDDVHYVGWCAANAQPLVPPTALQYRVSDWKEFLLRKLVGANTLQPSVHAKAKSSFERCPLRPGMWLEVVDRMCLSVMTVATVDKIVGSRLRLRYLQPEVKSNDVVIIFR